MPTNAAIPASLPPRLRGHRGTPQPDSTMYDAVIDEIDGRRIRIGGPMARRLGLVQLSRLRPGPRDHGRGHRTGRPVGNASRVVAHARQPSPVPADRGTSRRPAARRRHAVTADHLADPPVGHSRFSPAGARSSSRATPTRPSMTAACTPAASARRCTGSASGDLQQLADQLRSAPTGTASGLHGRRQQHDRQRPRPARRTPGCAASTARCSTSTTRTASASSASGATTRARPYGWGGNAIVRHRGESYDDIVLVGGFSKAYSSLLAFLAVPTRVEEPSEGRRGAVPVLGTVADRVAGQRPGRPRRQRRPAATRCGPRCTA